jgi:hypothetical protein
LIYARILTKKCRLLTKKSKITHVVVHEFWGMAIPVTVWILKKNA